jgi:UDP-N-acetyl-D-glucosamine/UDP-N-acetyl-D-galactosamine dehydrogenase
MIHDPLGSAEEAHEEYGVTLSELENFRELDALILAVSHQEYLADRGAIYARIRQGGVLIDVKSVIDPRDPGLAARGIRYWSL